MLSPPSFPVHHRNRERRATIGAAVLFAILSTGLRVPASGAGVPPPFVLENAVPGVAFDTPTSIAFLPDGRMLVGEKRGVVWMVENGVRLPTPFWSAENEVLNEGDRGLLSIAVHPNFNSNRYVYFLYTADPDSNGVDNDNNAFGRLTRYRAKASNTNLADTKTRTLLIGYDWRNGPLSDSPSHTEGGLRFGLDGSLLISIGDGASFTQADSGGIDPTAFGPTRTDPLEDIGAFRAQYLSSLCAKVLRIDPLTGRGYPSNPYAEVDLGSVRSRVWAYGFRNPYRFAIRPGTGSANPADGDPGTLVIGDVGWNLWEELNVARTGGGNYGWPCHEGFPLQPDYQFVAPSHHGCETIGSPDNPGLLEHPTAAWSHTDSSASFPPGLIGNCALAGVFYTGTRYPAEFQGRFFLADYGFNWLHTATFDSADAIVSIEPFGTNLDGPVDFATDPISGDLYYVAILPQEVRRLRYAGGSGASTPVAVASASPTFGVAPLTVTFSSLGTYDPDGDPPALTWLFGDGTGSSLANPIHDYLVPGSYQAILTAADTSGNQSSDTVRVNVAETASFPTAGVLDDFNRPDGPLLAPWTDGIAGLAIDNQAVVQSSTYSTAVWDSVFGADQEAFITLSDITPEADHNLMLKLQGVSWTDGYVEVKYQAVNTQVVVQTYAPGEGAVFRGLVWPVAFTADDQFGARAHADGTVEVFRNGASLGTVSVAPWTFSALGGRIGVMLAGATSSRLDDFGGGDVVLAPNDPPVATLFEPADSSFFVAGEFVHLVGGAADTEDPVDSLDVRWQVNTIHNNHTHPSSFVSFVPVDSFPAENHDDGTGVHLDALFIVTDTRGVADSARCAIYPEVDLAPSPVSVLPDPGDAGNPTRFDFTLSNTGRMPAPFSHWVLQVGDVAIAEGDTLFAPQDSIAFSVTVALGLPPGDYPLRLVADSAGVVHETDEGDNAWTGTLTLIPGAVAVPHATRTLELSAPRPNPTAAAAEIGLSLPHAARVRFTVLDLQGRVVWRDTERNLPPGQSALRWDGRSRGMAVPAGVYLARIEVDGRPTVRRITILH